MIGIPKQAYAPFLRPSGLLKSRPSCGASEPLGNANVVLLRISGTAYLIHGLGTVAVATMSVDTWVSSKLLSFLRLL